MSDTVTCEAGATTRYGERCGKCGTVVEREYPQCRGLHPDDPSTGMPCEFGCGQYDHPYISCEAAEAIRLRYRHLATEDSGGKP